MKTSIASPMLRALPSLVGILACCLVLPAFLWCQPARAQQINNGQVSLSLDAAAHVYTLSDARTGRVWTSSPADGYAFANVLPVEGTSLVLDLVDKAAPQDTYRCEIHIADNGDVVWTLVRTALEAPFVELAYPPVFYAPLQRGMMLFCDRSGGNYLPLSEDYPDKRLTVYANTAALDMPWFGVVDEATGDGLMLLFETPVEAAVNLIRDPGGNHWPGVSWFATMNTFGYSRTVRLRLTPEGGYVRQAKEYRAWAKERGLVKTLAQKAVERPLVQWLRGAMVVWGRMG
jgi:hypothetical protein